MNAFSLHENQLLFSSREQTWDWSASIYFFDSGAEKTWLNEERLRNPWVGSFFSSSWHLHFLAPEEIFWAQIALLLLSWVHYAPLLFWLQYAPSSLHEELVFLSSLHRAYNGFIECWRWIWYSVPWCSGALSQRYLFKDLGNLKARSTTTIYEDYQVFINIARNDMIRPRKKSRKKESVLLLPSSYQFWKIWAELEPYRSQFNAHD